MTQRHSFLAPPKKNPVVFYYPSDLWEYFKLSNLVAKPLLFFQRKNNSQI